jgi:hypothetical protein
LLCGGGEEKGEVKGRRGRTDGVGNCSAVGIGLAGIVGSPRVRPNRDGVFFSRALDWSMETTVFLSVLIVDFDF